MSIDRRTRRQVDLVELTAEAVFDDLVPTAIAAHGELAARGAVVRDAPPLGLDVGERTATLTSTAGTLALEPGLDGAGVVAALAEDALSDLVQDHQSTMGLAMTSRVRLTEGSIDDWIGWEPVLRALLDGRPVHEPGDIDFVDSDGTPLDLDRVFTSDDDHDEMAHFLEQAGFLHVAGVFEPGEMDALRADIDEGIAAATPDDGGSWWAEDSDGRAQAVRILNFQERSETLPGLLGDDRLTWIGSLTGDGHRSPTTAEGLVKPLDIVKGLSDLPWHKDCGQGRHSYLCNALTCGISVTGADRASGALGVVPGSHRANTVATARDRRLDLPPRVIETAKGDVTVHCSDTLHRAHPPTARPRHVVYTSFRLPPLPGDEPRPDPRYSREARAELSSVEDRIGAATTDVDPYRRERG